MQGRLFTLFEGTGWATPVPSYFLLLVTGFIFATAMGAIWAKRIGQDPDVIINLGLAMLLAGVAGARILHVLADGYFWDYVHLCTDPSKVGWQITQAECSGLGEGSAWDAAANVCRPTETNCFAWAEFYKGGLTYYGGFIGAAGVGYWLLKQDRFPFWRAADMAGLVIPVGLCFGRMGCLLAGCCFGVQTGGPMGLIFPPHSPASEQQWKAHELATSFAPSLPVHPTQIYESAGSLALAAFLILWLHGRKRYDGQVFLGFVAGYAVLRFILEFWRNDDRGGLLFLSTSQWIGVVLVGVVFVLHRALTTRLAPKTQPA